MFFIVFNLILFVFFDLIFITMDVVSENKVFIIIIIIMLWSDCVVLRL